MSRLEFAAAFLRALGVDDIRFDVIQREFIKGEVFYHDTIDPEKQGFRWNINEQNAPGAQALSLVRLLHDEALLDIDRIIVARSDLYERYLRRTSATISFTDFARLLAIIESVQIAMLVEGKECDTFYIHE